MQNNSKIIDALTDIVRTLHDHPETLRGNSRIHYCYHRAIAGLRAIEAQDEFEARAVTAALENWGVTSTFDNTQARAEGWSIIEANGVPTIQRDDMAGFFEDDKQVWVYLAKNALTSEYHANALRFIRRENQAEYREIASYVLGYSLKENP